MATFAPALQRDSSRSLLHTIGLHLLPGALATAVYALLAPVVMAWGFPALLGLLLAAALVLIPCELGVLLYQAKQRFPGRPFPPIVQFREPLPAWQYVALPLGFVVWAFAVSGATAPLESHLAHALFSWLPDWAIISDLAHASRYARSAWLATFIVGLAVNGVAGPIAEELYFRGYLLPRLAPLGWWAPLLNVVLFSLYHFWTPWQILSRILLVVPLAYGVWWKRNLYVGMVAHCAINLIGWVLTFGVILASAP